MATIRESSRTGFFFANCKLDLLAAWNNFPVSEYRRRKLPVRHVSLSRFHLVALLTCILECHDNSCEDDQEANDNLHFPLPSCVVCIICQCQFNLI